MKRYAVAELDGGAAGREVAAGSAVQVLLAVWEELVPVELMQQLRLTELPALQRLACERVREAAGVSG